MWRDLWPTLSELSLRSVGLFIINFPTTSSTRFLKYSQARFQQNRLQRGTKNRGKILFFLFSNRLFLVIVFASHSRRWKLSYRYCMAVALRRDRAQSRKVFRLCCPSHVILSQIQVRRIAGGEIVFIALWIETVYQSL